MSTTYVYLTGQFRECAGCRFVSERDSTGKEVQQPYFFGKGIFGHEGGAPRISLTHIGDRLPQEAQPFIDRVTFVGAFQCLKLRTPGTYKLEEASAEAEMKNGLLHIDAFGPTVEGVRDLCLAIREGAIVPDRSFDQPQRLSDEDVALHRLVETVEEGKRITELEEQLKREIKNLERLQARLAAWIAYAELSWYKRLFTSAPSSRIRTS